ncbi:unnamed protein product, partial [Ectocarpus sp. 12 AP-2014]
PPPRGETRRRAPPSGNACSRPTRRRRHGEHSRSTCWNASTRTCRCRFGRRSSRRCCRRRRFDERTTRYAYRPTINAVSIRRPGQDSGGSGRSGGAPFIGDLVGRGRSKGGERRKQPRGSRGRERRRPGLPLPRGYSWGRRPRRGAAEGPG